MSMEQEQLTENNDAPRMEDIRPNMTDAEKRRALDEILRVLRGEQ